MRCLSCNVILSDFEATRKYKDTKDYVDLCNSCFASCATPILTDDRYDLEHDEDTLDEA